MQPKQPAKRETKRNPSTIFKAHFYDDIEHANSTHRSRFIGRQNVKYVVQERKLNISSFVSKYYCLGQSCVSKSSMSHKFLISIIFSYLSNVWEAWINGDDWQFTLQLNVHQKELWFWNVSHDMTRYCLIISDNLPGFTAHDHKIVFLLIFISVQSNFIITTNKNREKTRNHQTMPCQMMAQVHIEIIDRSHGD